jgi:hypothetical protein
MRQLTAFAFAALLAASLAGTAYAGCGGEGGYLVDWSGPEPVILADNDPNAPNPQPAADQSPLSQDKK